MLLSGAIANYLAGVIADQTSQASFDAAGAVNYSIDAYITVFSQITWGALACVGVVLVIWLYHSLKVRTRRLAVEYCFLAASRPPASPAAPACDQLSGANSPA